MVDTNALIDQLVKDSTAVKRATHPYMQCLKWLGGLAWYVAILLVFFRPRIDILYKLQTPLFLGEILSLLLITVTTALSAALLSYPDLMQKKTFTLAPLGAFSLFIVVMIAAWHGDQPPAKGPVHEMTCTICITLMSLVPAMWMFTTLRKAATTHAALAGITATLCAFSIGALILRISELTDSISHVVEWHYLPMLAMTVVGLILGRLVLKW